MSIAQTIRSCSDPPPKDADRYGTTIAASPVPRGGRRNEAIWRGAVPMLKFAMESFNAWGIAGGTVT